LIREHEERIKNLDGKDPLDVWERSLSSL